MVDKKLASKRLLVLGTIIGLGMTLSGCSKGDSDSCHNVFTAALLSQSSHQNSPFETALSELQDRDHDGVADLNDSDDLNGSNNQNDADDSKNSPDIWHFTPEPTGSFSLKIDNYNVVTWDPKGEFNSGGTLQIDSPDFEGRDVGDIINWLQNLPNH